MPDKSREMLPLTELGRFRGVVLIPELPLGVLRPFTAGWWDPSTAAGSFLVAE